MSEDDLKRKLQTWLEAAGWRVQVVWGRGRGTDIEAQRGGQRWIIEAKGCGTLDAMRVNYFLAILRELLQRMADPDALYGIELPATDANAILGCALLDNPGKIPSEI